MEISSVITRLRGEGGQEQLTSAMAGSRGSSFLARLPLSLSLVHYLFLCVYLLLRFFFSLLLPHSSSSSSFFFVGSVVLSKRLSSGMQGRRRQPPRRPVSCVGAWPRTGCAPPTRAGARSTAAASSAACARARWSGRWCFLWTAGCCASGMPTRPWRPTW